MNYYPFHLGDYIGATAHLEPIEDIAYRRMMDVYYLNEDPLPEDVNEIGRLIRMRSHCDVIANVLREFFVLAEGEWRNDRIDREISKYQDKSRKAKESAEARWGNKGKKRNANASGTHSEGNANQEPRTNNQIKTIIEYLNEKAGKKFKPVESHAKFIRERFEEGHTAEDICRVIDRKAHQWRDDPEMNQYLRPATLFNAEKFNQYVGDLDSPLPQKKQDKPEWTKLPFDDNALEGFASKHRLPAPGSHDTYHQYREKLKSAIRQRAGQEGVEL